MRNVILAVVFLAAASWQVVSAQSASQPPASQPAASQPASAATYMYAGQARDQKWFDEKYKLFADKFLRITTTRTDKKTKTKTEITTFKDLGEWLLKNPVLPKPNRARGLGEENEIIVLPAKTFVYRIIGPDEILAFAPQEKEGDLGNLTDPAKGTGYVIHVKFISSAGLKEGSPFATGKFVPCQKKFQFNEGNKNIGSFDTYRPFSPLTKEEFAELLASGQRLYTYTKAGDKITVKEVE